jgi:choline dehydrogenase-like flavoprotein
MNCKQGTAIIIGQMTDLLGRIADDTYAKSLLLFNGSSIGQHFRHIVDFYGCLTRGVGGGRVDYAQRQRDTRIETEPGYAAAVLQQFYEQLATMDEVCQVEVVADFSAELNETRPVVLSTVGREMMYAYDHAVHHLAMIKMGLKSVAPALEVDRNLGVAPSTVKHWNS